VRTLPEEMIRALAPFAPLFSKRLWRHVQVLVTGAFPQLLDAEPLAPLCARWAWIKRSASTATIGRSEKR
jgi:leucyl-tRNA synthetase